LLKKIGLKFLVDTGDFFEDLNRGLEPVELVKTISVGKARSVAHKYPDAIIIAADTVGVLRGKIVGKPHTAEEAREILQGMSGKSHIVITGFTILDTKSDRLTTRSAETRVYFKTLSREEIEHYVKSGEPLDKAGAYAIQGLGGVMVEKIVGDYHNVVGLPLNALAESLKEFGIKVL
jgi:septum formation protein